MSKLYTILCNHANWAHRWGKDKPNTYIYGSGKPTDTIATKQEIKALMLELIGEDEVMETMLANGYSEIDVDVRNQLRAELRAEVQAL